MFPISCFPGSLALLQSRVYLDWQFVLVRQILVQRVSGTSVAQGTWTNLQIDILGNSWTLNNMVGYMGLWDHQGRMCLIGCKQGVSLKALRSSPPFDYGSPFGPLQYLTYSPNKLTYNLSQYLRRFLRQHLSTATNTRRMHNTIYTYDNEKHVSFVKFYFNIMKIKRIIKKLIS